MAVGAGTVVGALLGIAWCSVDGGHNALAGLFALYLSDVLRRADFMSFR